MQYYGFYSIIYFNYDAKTPYASQWGGGGSLLWKQVSHEQYFSEYYTILNLWSLRHLKSVCQLLWKSDKIGQFYMFVNNDNDNDNEFVNNR